MRDWFDLNNDGKLDTFEEACKWSHINESVKNWENDSKSTGSRYTGSGNNSSNKRELSTGEIVATVIFVILGIIGLIGLMSEAFGGTKKYDDYHSYHSTYHSTTRSTKRTTTSSSRQTTTSSPSRRTSGTSTYKRKTSTYEEKTVDPSDHDIETYCQ